MIEKIWKAVPLALFVLGVVLALATILLHLDEDAKRMAFFFVASGAVGKWFQSMEVK